MELDEGNAVYYWRTDLRLDSTERAFLKAYNINKVYCRYFDVVMDESGEPMPNATIVFNDTLPAGIEIIPTVYITIDCLQRPHKGLAEKLVKRIRQMNETNDISGVKEIQIDHDYTARNMKVYYDFLREVRGAWREECGERNAILSSSTNGMWRPTCDTSTTIPCPWLQPIPCSAGCASSAVWR